MPKKVIVKHQTVSQPKRKMSNFVADSHKANTDTLNLDTSQLNKIRGILLTKCQ